MKFRTEINPLPASFLLAPQDLLAIAGSCFAENLSVKLLEAGFRVNVNPFGVMYNPVSIAQSLYDLIKRKVYNESDLFVHEGIYHSFSHHSRFSGRDEAMVLEKINAAIQTGNRFLKESSCLIITFGTAQIYRLISSGKVVANCHKLPAKVFREERCSMEQITALWNPLIRALHELNPSLKILFTVSPIRYWKNGAHENQLNKAILLLAVNQLVQENTSCFYFPAYEIMMDDLRDYRFYSDDLIHPNPQAIDYIWEKFGATFFDAKTMEAIKIYEKQQRAEKHRPLIPE